MITIPVMVLIGMYGRRLFSRVLKLQTVFVIPAVLIFAVIGSYSARNNWMDVVITIVTGFIGVFLKKAKIPIAPIVIGIILGPIVERNFRRSIPIAAASGNSLFSYIVLRPISLLIIVLIVIILFAYFKTSLAQKKITSVKE
jgi:putative tricarboxylic transport membrane protein